MRILPSNVRTPMVSLGRSGVGLLEKRLLAVSSLDMDQDVSVVGSVWNRETDDVILLDDEADWHNNHAEDPTTDTLSMSAVAAFNMVRPRSLTSNISINDHVHVVLEGYHAPSTSQHEVTANETINIGQPVYVSATDTVNLADADTLNTSHVLGLAITDATANTTVIVLSEGSVTRSDWTAIVGTANLVPGAIYYLSTTAGQMTTTPPTGDGDNVVRCGLAVNLTKFDIEINEVAIL